MKIEQAIQQKAFRNAREKAGINLMYTASWLSNELMKALKPSGISVPQFNILRILKGQKGKPVPLWLVTERMIDKMSNTSRLIDKLVAKGLVDRRQCPNDRRQVDLLLTASGLELINAATQSVDKHTAKLIGHMTDSQMQMLNSLLDTLRSEHDTK